MGNKLNRNNWKILPLERVVDILDSKRIPLNSQERIQRISGKNESELYPYYGATGEVGKVDDYIFDEELVALGEDGVPFLDPNKPKSYMLYGKTWVNNHAHVLKAKSNILENRYLCYFLNNFAYQDYVNGTTRLKLTQANMRKIPVLVPPLETQHHIATTLDHATALIEKRKTQIAELDKLVKAVFLEMFGDPNILSKDKIKLSEICTIKSSKRIFESEYTTSGVPFFRTKEIVELSKGNNISTELFITEERFKDIQEKFETPQKNDLLISAVGTIGTIWIVDGRDFYFKDGNLLWIKGNDKFLSTYISFLLTLRLEKYKSELSKGTAYSALTIDKLKSLEINFADISLQTLFAEKVCKIQAEKDRLQRSLVEMEQYLQSLMAKFFE